MVLLKGGCDKMTRIDKKHYVNVKELMNKQLPKPRLKPTIIVDHNEWLPIIKVDTGRCQ